ncbi:hypothetical protein ScPMuIL_003957 [Solemya velum]
MADVSPKVPSQSASSYDNNAIYHEISPTLVWAVRGFNVAVGVMLLISFILSLMEGKEHSAYYLLTCNTVISSLVGAVVNWWYKNGDLGSEKYWYIFTVGAVIMFQCVTTDIYVYHKSPVPLTTTTPVFTTPISNITTPTITM